MGEADRGAYQSGDDQKDSPDPSGVSALELDLERHLGAPIDRLLSLAPAALTDEPDDNVLAPGEAENSPQSKLWRYALFPVSYLDSWQDYQLTNTLYLSACFRGDTREIWYLQLPFPPRTAVREPNGIQYFFRRIRPGDSFDQCMLNLGPPTRSIQETPGSGRAWWAIGNVVYRVDYSSEDYQDIEVRKKGEIDWIAAYRTDLAPPGFDDGYRREVDRLSNDGAPPK